MAKSSRRAAKSSKNKESAAAGSVTISDQKLLRGEGGELHQIARGDVPVLTTAQGGPVSDDQNSLKIGPRGPALLEDFHFREKIFHFDHERIPERVVHARGYGAHGFFENYKPLSKYTRADLFQRAGERTPAFVRFSTVAGSKGSADLARDVRGFAVKLYTQEGNWDIVGNNIPVFFIQDAIKFPDIIHAVKEEPDRAFPQAQSAHDNFWDFISLTPESMHMIMWVMSDRAIPRSFRFMEGFGVHTFRLVNAKNESTFVKFHWKPKLGLAIGALERGGQDQRRRSGFSSPRSVERNSNRQFSGMGIAVSAVRSGLRRQFRLRHSRSDQTDSGRNPAADPGRPAGARPHAGQFLRRDRTGRVHDPERAARHRLLQRSAAAGPQLFLSRYPVEASRAARTSPIFRSTRRNARSIISSRMAIWPCAIRSGTSTISRIRSARARGNPPSAGSRPFADVEQGAKQRLRAESFADHYSQARQFFISQTPGEQQHIVAALTFELSKVKTPVIRERMVSHLLNIDETLAGKVGEALGLKAMPKPADAAVPTRQDLEASPALSIVEKGPQRFEGRKLGILVTDGTDAAILKALKAGAGQGRRDVRNHRAEGRRRQGQRRQLDRSRPDDRRRTIGIVRRGRVASGGGRDGRSGAGIDRARFRRRCFCALQVHRLCRGGRAAVGKGRDRRRTTSTKVASRWHRPRMLRASSARSAQLRVWDREPKVKMR